MSSVPAKPEPLSTPFTAGMLSIALREIGLELVEHRLAPAGGHAARDGADHAADGVAVLARALDALDHLRGDRGIGAADVVGVDGVARDRRVVDRCRDAGDLVDPRDDLDTPRAREQLLRDRARGDAARGLARARTAAAGDGADAVLRVVRVVGVRSGRYARAMPS